MRAAGVLAILLDQILMLHKDGFGHQLVWTLQERFDLLIGLLHFVLLVFFQARCFRKPSILLMPRISAVLEQ